ncbi:alkylation response protein AidB-like acyl-CoA dehydrogenase [Actinoplanes tereljensis]|uniref:Acyl-CoA dehydrogenase n=1 Tax=Paractinoplanes tereljensis TaxID=571912 RepID=A0A919TVK3_9ACTN|nr:acyl-CoA dehydrogenase family protein [Actinoplanes tereljensis]GIF24051.1 acyl-CoA dehydrogenase [Actinoplanes tereljensis]
MTTDTIASSTSPLFEKAEPSAYFSDQDYHRFHERAAKYDRDNLFFDEDLADLRERGYLRAALPVELGGGGLGFAALAREQRRLAYWAPATALAINMHLYWTGPATALAASGGENLGWLLRAVADGQVLAAGHGERGNDLGLDDSLTQAVRQADGSYVVTGRKTFTSLSPVWDHLGIHARDDTDPAHPKIVHLFVDRTAKGVSTEKTWDALGVRATASDDTVLDNVHVPAGRVVGISEIGEPYPPYVTGILQWYIPLVSNVYFGIARRALDLAELNAQARTSLALPGQRHADKPAVQRQLAEAEILLDAAWSLLERATEDLDAATDHGEWWTPRLFSVKEFTTTTARRVVDIATQVVGASSVSRSNELERLYRDVRTGSLHPPNTDAILDVIGKFAVRVLP